jgi:hypothetical protein
LREAEEADRLRFMMGPDHPVMESVLRYAEHRTPPGAFVRAVLENDLKRAVMFADRENRRRIYEIMVFVYNIVPSEAWDTKEKVARWLGEKA